MNEKPLNRKTILISGAAKRIGRLFALACARAGADIIIQHGHSEDEAMQVRDEIESFGQRGWILAADFGKPAEVARFISQANELAPLYALVNSASIFEPLSFNETSYEAWQRHIAINLTAPFLLSQAFARQVPENGQGRIVNILDWRALRPAADHFPYTISKAALAALTRSMAVALAPHVTVNGLALGAILPPADINPADTNPVGTNPAGTNPVGNMSAGEKIIESVPAKRWSAAGEAEDALLFLLTGPAYITGEIIHVDGGRHLV